VNCNTTHYRAVSRRSEPTNGQTFGQKPKEEKAFSLAKDDEYEDDFDQSNKFSQSRSQKKPSEKKKSSEIEDLYEFERDEIEDDYF